MILNVYCPLVSQDRLWEVFSYEDIASNEVDKYTYKFIDDGQLEGRDVWIL